MKNLKGEIWKDIPGYEGRYQVSNKGRVKRLTEIIMRHGKYGLVPVLWTEREIRTVKKHEVTVDLYDQNRNAKRFSVSRLVLEIFVGPCPDGMECCHFPDQNVDNCNLENLRWDSHANNTSIDRYYQSGVVKLLPCQVKEIRKRFKQNKKLVKTQLAKEYGVSLTTIRNICDEKKWRHLLPGFVPKIKTRGKRRTIFQ